MKGTVYVVSTWCAAAFILPNPALAQITDRPKPPASKPDSVNTTTADPVPPVAPSAAAISPDSDTIQNTDIVVTAQRRRQLLNDVPMSVSALSGEQLAARGITDVAGLARITPGLSFVESGNSTPVYSLRGVGFFDSSIGAKPTVSVYLDEAPIPYSIEATGASFDLERVEVLKGPQGTLYGQNATGGAINYVAAKPTSVLALGSTISYGRFNTAELSAYISGPLTSTLNARLSAQSITSGDWQRSYTRDDNLGAKRFAEARLQLDWRPSDDLTFNINVNGFKDNGDTQAAQLVGIIYQVPRLASAIPALTTYPLAPPDNRAADWNAGQPLRRHNGFYQGSLRGSYQITPDISIISLTTLSHMNIHQLVDQDGTSISNASQDISGRLDSFSEELRLTGNVGVANFTVGSSYAHDRSNELIIFRDLYGSVLNSLPTGPFDGLDLYNKQDSTTKAVFGSVDVKLLPAVSVDAGLRYTGVDLDYRACSRAGNQGQADTLTGLYNIFRRGQGLAPIALQTGQCITVDATFTPQEVVGSLNQSNISWRAGLNWKPSPGTLVYGNVSRGYKAGSTPTPPVLGIAGYQPVTQESVLAYELGAKLPIIPRVIDISAAAFYYDYSNKQVLGRVLTPPTQFGALLALVNVPKSRIYGAEGQVSLYPTKGLVLTAAATYLNTKVTADFINYTITAVAANFRGDPFPYTPKYQVVGDVRYEMPVSDRVSAFIGATLSYRSSTTSGFGNVSSLEVKDYALLDFQGGVRSLDRRYELTLFVRNATDTYYWTNVAKISDTVRRYAGDPRMYGIRLTTKL